MTNNAGKIYKNTVRLDNPKSVHRLIARTVNMLITDQINGEKARAIGYLCSIMQKGLETVDIEERICVLEKLVERKRRVISGG